MAFFKKLKDRLFKSSSKIDEGLEAIVEDGGVQEPLEPDAYVADADALARKEEEEEEERAQAERLARAQEEAERAAQEAEAARIATQARIVEERAAAQAEAQKQADIAAEAEQRAQREAEAQRQAQLQAEAQRQAEREAEAERQAQLKAEAARQAEISAQAQRAEAEQAAAEALAKADADRAEAERQAQADAEEQVRVAAEAERIAEAQRQAEIQAEAQRQAEIAAEEKRQAELKAQAEQQAQRAAAAAKAEAERAEEEERARIAAEEAAQRAAEARAAAEREAAEATAKPGLLGRILGRKPAAAVMRRTLDDDMLEQLEELLIASDMGVDTALRVTANMAEGRMGRKLSVAEIKDLMATEIARIMEPVAKPLPLYPQKPQVVLVVGVNGSGKTTTIGKLASQFRAAGKKVVIAAGDTFRAAAVEQLQVWGERAGVPVLTAPEGSDPASLAFDAMTKAQEDGADLLMIDTAGRLQNRQDLMEELSKIVRVIRKKDESAPHNTLLVLDATTGQNALNQVKVFQEVSDVSGLVMTKLDGTAKGGVLVALADKFGLPIHAIGVGEQIDDLSPFDPEDFAAALTGSETA